MSTAGDESLRALLAVLADGRFHSGQELGERLGVSRSAVWKQLKKLPDLGVLVHSVKGRGYRLPEGLDLLDVEILRAFLGERASQRLREMHLALSLESTNASALLACQGGERHGALFLAEQQTAGRGRRGRSWHSPFASNLYFSLIWCFTGGAAALEGLSLVVGLAMARGLEAVGVSEVQLKWPNDLLWSGRKLGGILLEMTGDASGQCQVVIGVGLNVAMPAEGAQRIDQPWVDVREILGGPSERNRLLAALLDQLVAALELFEREGFAAFRDEWQARHAHQGRRVTLITPRVEERGVCLGVDASGALLLETESGVQAFHGGEISVRASDDS